MARDHYLVPAGAAEAAIEVKGSRFLGWVRRVDSEDEARAYVAEARRRFWDARHHCSAFVIGADGALQRSNDDGEPSGTAGAPMLEVLVRREVRDVVAVVTRWFGGTLLGAGGLVRAYSETTAAALDAAGVVRRELRTRVEVTVSHGEVGKVENELRARGVAILGVDYGAGDVVLTAAAHPAAVASIAELVAAITHGSGGVAAGGTLWVP
ncbi:YigZ family protein [Mumia sp.]|uniref:YigZ family protein n=1 Tax=Mumia sp. TaxID=1965300 RepID=UPI0026035E24|nr:YigZ family protein [Mumia sp.]MDD9347796.1 YigZ family protein [Mumia sp.]